MGRGNKVIAHQHNDQSPGDLEEGLHFPMLRAL
jgi:hypothetical protein